MYATFGLLMVVIGYCIERWCVDPALYSDGDDSDIASQIGLGIAYGMICLGQVFATVFSAGGC